MIAIIQSVFHQSITDVLVQEACQYLAYRGRTTQVYQVAGAFEIPVVASWLAREKEVQGIIAVAVVIRGETDHYQLVVESVFTQICALSIQSGKPITTAILPCHHIYQAWQRAKGPGNAGVHAAMACDQLLRLQEGLQNGLTGYRWSEVLPGLHQTQRLKK